MLGKTQLYLLGGSPAYSVYANDFVKASGGPDAKIAALVQTRAGWEKHKSEIITPWQDRGITQYEVIVPNEAGLINVEEAITILKRATGVFIGGGHTPTYHQLFATEPIRAVIREQYAKGVPVAGISAGALIAMEKCQLTPDETGKERLQVVEGLNLANGFVIGVHFTEWDAFSDVLDTMKATHAQIGIGIDEPACVMCENGKIVKVLGKSVYRIEMTDFSKMSYAKTKL
jgi:cyanophycinase